MQPRQGYTLFLCPRVDNLAMAMSPVASTRGLALTPAYAENLMPWSVVSRPLEGETPTIDLTVGHSKSNASPILKPFVSRLDELVGPNQKHLTPFQSSPARFPDQPAPALIKE